MDCRVKPGNDEERRAKRLIPRAVNNCARHHSALRSGRPGAARFLLRFDRTGQGVPLRDAAHVLAMWKRVMQKRPSFVLSHLASAALVAAAATVLAAAPAAAAQRG